jgi:Zn-dependent M28 family amino/carboxypeptidase
VRHHRAIAGAVCLLSLAAARPTSDEVREIDAKLVACGTRHALSSWNDPKRGIGCARDLIVAELTDAAKGNTEARVVVDKFEATSPRTRDVPAPLESVYLVVSGTDPVLKSTAFFVSGHYDSMCSEIMDSACDAPGADDDASGTTVVISAAKLLAGRKHRATIVFAALAGEEQGLLGGKRLVQWAKDQGLTVGGVLNNDIVGATNGSKDARPRVFCEEDPATPARGLGLWLDEMLGRDSVRLIFRKDRFGRGGDHLPFLETGAPAVRFTEPREDYRHQHQTPRTEGGVEYGDLQKFMDFDFLAKVAGLNAEALLRLANAPAPPTAALTEGAVKPDTTVTFEAAADAERSGFEILTRDTTEARWTVLQQAPAAGTVTLAGVRIDDALFAVRSVGKNGERSIAVEAKPQVRRPAGVPPATVPPASPPPK